MLWGGRMKISGFTNVYRTDNMLLCGPVYEEEDKAEKTGKLVKGYVCTVPINCEIPDGVTE